MDHKNNGFKQDIYYNCKNPVPIKDVIRSLQGIEAVAASLPEALNNILEANIAGISLELESVDIGTEWLKYVAWLNFESAEDEENFFRRFGKKHPMIRNLINIAILALILAAVYRSLVHSNGTAVQIDATNSVVIAAGADLVGVMPKEFQEAINEAVKANPKVMKGAANLLAPARNDPESSVYFGRYDGVRLGPEAIAEAPLQLIDPGEFIEKDYKNVLIDIRATDLDFRTKGWSVLAAGLDKRLPSTIYPHIDRSTLKGSLYANLGVLYKRDSEDPSRLVPSNIIIKSIGSSNLPVGIVRSFIGGQEEFEPASTIDDHNHQQRLFN